MYVKELKELQERYDAQDSLLSSVLETNTVMGKRLKEQEERYDALVKDYRAEPRFNAVVTQLVQIHNDESGKPQFARYTHIECKDRGMLEILRELASKLTE